MKATLPSNEAISVLRNVYGKLDPGEKVLLCGQGKVIRRIPLPTMAAILFSIFIFPLAAAWLFAVAVVQAVVHGPVFLPNLVIIGVIVVVLSAIYMICRFLAATRTRWHVFTSKRLLVIDDHGSIKTVAARSGVTRIEGTSNQVTLLVNQQGTAHGAEIVIFQVTGLPEIVGGYEPEWLLSPR